MASEGTDLSTRKSAENIALCHFKRQKVAISNIIITSFPFLELLRDYGFINNELYEKSKKSFETSVSQKEVIYHVLSEVEKTFNLSLLKALFSKDIMETYPGLKDIYETFKKVIPNIELFLRNDGEENEKRRDIQESLEQGTVDFGNNSISGKTKKRRRTTMHTDDTVNFNAEILPVTCGKMMGMLIKRKLQRAILEDMMWYLNKNEYLPQPPHDRKRKPENAEKCKICGDEGKLFKCSFCLIFFHEYCHIPPVEPERKDWICTFCITEVSSGSQQHASYSEVLARRMGPKEKLNCVFLLLKLYYHLENNIFRSIPHEHYVQKASQCLETLRTLDEIKNKLNGGCYTKVKGFVLGMNKIFQDPKHDDSLQTEKEFKKNFKEVFSIQ
ncbi:nuclear body protein SP140-like protein [Eptesicus fuscus]|uniref:nuclear body protein SP140-like protein n=1 Tax=Eptesicus fuscus TaxID=29078 RepID=UPI0024047600|nr:nuclear body protein SP140-like protein [Eptesicus fuscus]